MTEETIITEEPERKFTNEEYRKAEHLRPFWWKKGVSGNPAGKPKGTVSLAEKLRQYLTEHPEELRNIIVQKVTNLLLNS